ncbi:MAG: dTDP-4-dehydrorhamnose 3,5-epimerase [Acidobacteriota bacterium]
MQFTTTILPGVVVVKPRRFEDERGYFSTCFCAGEFEKHDIRLTVLQSNVAMNRRRGTLRGMHYQDPPFAQAKLVQCLAGAIYDVVIDLRSESATFRKWVSVELTAANGKLLYVPEGLAHGYQTLEDNTHVAYHVNNRYAPELARGVRWDDPAFGVEWPAMEERTIIARDRTYPDFVW